MPAVFDMVDECLFGRLTGAERAAIESLATGKVPLGSNTEKPAAAKGNGAVFPLTMMSRFIHIGHLFEPVLAI